MINFTTWIDGYTYRGYHANKIKGRKLYTSICKICQCFRNDIVLHIFVSMYKIKSFITQKLTTEILFSVEEE